MHFWQQAADYTVAKVRLTRLGYKSSRRVLVGVIRSNKVKVGRFSVAQATAILGMATIVGFNNPSQAACRQFAVVGEDASYLLLDGETWEVLRVGAYWVTGVRQIAGVLPGSSDRQAAFETNALVNVHDQEPMIAGPIPEDGGPNAIAVLRMLSYAPRTTALDFSRGRYQEFIWPPYYYALEGGEGESSSDQWVHWLRENTLFRSVKVDGANVVYQVAGEFAPEVFVSGEEAGLESLAVLNIWDIGDMDLTMPFCAVDDTLYFTDDANYLSAPAAGGPIDRRRPLAALTGEGYELTPLHTKNCKVLASRAIEDDPAQLEYALYDIATETIESEFASPNPARNILFAGGSRWLQQLARDPTAEDPEPSTNFRLIDTTTGEVLHEAELDVPGGALIEEMQCDPDTPRAVIAGPRRIWLLDPQTLTVIAENEVPFERNYFVFE